MAHTSRDANLLGAAALAVAERLPADAADATLIALSTWLGGTTIDGLARVLHLTHSGAVRLADRLAGDGLLERRPGPDGRSRALHLTATGQRRAGALQAGRLDALEELLAPLDAAERGVLTPLLEKLLGGLTTGHESAGRTCRLCDPDVCGHPDTCPVTLAAR